MATSCAYECAASGLGLNVANLTAVNHIELSSECRSHIRLDYKSNNEPFFNKASFHGSDRLFTECHPSITDSHRAAHTSALTTPFYEAADGYASDGLPWAARHVRECRHAASGKGRCNQPDFADRPIVTCALSHGTMCRLPNKPAMGSAVSCSP